MNAALQPLPADNASEASEQVSSLARWPWHRWRGAWRRWSLWSLLVALVVSMLITLVWLAGRYEAMQVQDRLDRSAANAVADIRAALNRNLQDLQALGAKRDAQQWRSQAAEILQVRREIVRIEARDAQLQLRAFAETPYLPLPSEEAQSSERRSHSQLTCANALRLNGPAYSTSYFEVQSDGLGAEMMQVCLPLAHGDKSDGFIVATYSLHSVLTTQVSKNLTHSQEVSFTEPDGTRLALIGASSRGTRAFTAQQILDLPGNMLVLRLDYWHRAPSMFPNVLTALVTTMAIALGTVLVILVRDNRRRLRAERDLGEALAFRKAMEDSLITGLRARDLKGRISYVNPAFCTMVGFTSEELLGLHLAPYWPPEHAKEYHQRQLKRLAGKTPPSPEGYESVFMRKDGTRFPVLIFEAPLISAQGKHTGWMGSFLDLSEQRRIEEISRASQERLQATARLATVGEMASLLSHELTQPLATISSYAAGSLNLLGENDGASPDVVREQLQDLRTAMQRIAHQAERAGRVIKSVRDFVRRRDQSREQVQASELIDSVLPLVRMQARKLDVRVITEIDKDLPSVVCDAIMVEQVLLNLARNATQAMDGMPEQSRELTLRVRQTSDSAQASCLEFCVIDCGSGIDKTVAEQLFTPFFTTREEGMGLGLSLCRTVIEQHGGTLRHNPHQPRGTVFTFTLPISAQN